MIENFRVVEVFDVESWNYLAENSPEKLGGNGNIKFGGKTIATVTIKKTRDEANELKNSLEKQNKIVKVFRVTTR